MTYRDTAYLKNVISPYLKANLIFKFKKKLFGTFENNFTYIIYQKWSNCIFLFGSLKILILRVHFLEYTFLSKNKNCLNSLKFRIPDIEIYPVKKNGSSESMYRCPVLWTCVRTQPGNIAIYINIPGDSSHCLEKGVAIVLKEMK